MSLLMMIYTGMVNDYTGFLASGGNWDLTSFLNNSQKQVKIWGGAFLSLVGIVGVVYAAFQIVSGLMSQGKKQVSYGSQAILLLISGALATTGLTLVMNIAAGGKKTIEDLGVINALSHMDLSTITFMVKNGLLW